MEDGYKYMFTIQGVLKFLAVAFSCTTFALHADAKVYLISDAQKWVLAAFIIAFSISFLLMFFRLIGEYLNAEAYLGTIESKYEGV